MMAAEQTDGFWLSDLLGRSFQVPGAVDRRISGLALDSRRLDAGECFIAYPGHNLDGNDYLSHAYNIGCDYRQFLDVLVWWHVGGLYGLQG